MLSQEAGLAEHSVMTRLQAKDTQHPGREFVVDYIGLHRSNECSDKHSPRLCHHQSNLSCSADHDSEEGTDEKPDKELSLLLEYCPGGTIWNWIRKHPEEVGFHQWFLWARQLTWAVDFIHDAGLVHHDIKPHNILLTNSLDVRLSDFGAGLFLPESSHPYLRVADGLGRGTQPYSAPELFASPASNGGYGQAIDIYSLGVSLYIIGLTAQEPFHKIKSTMEMVVWIKKGGFWLWEDQGWVHDRGPVPKITTSRPSTSSMLSRSPSQRRLGVYSPNVESLSRSNSQRSLRPSPSSIPRISLAPINTRLEFEAPSPPPPVGAIPHPSPQSTLLQSPSPSLGGTSLDDMQPLRKSQPSTPISPLPLPSPLISPITPRSTANKADDRRSSGETVMRFLNGEIVPSAVVQLLKAMCHPDPQKRPDAKYVLMCLDQIEAEHEQVIY
ncbi:hypothetical protein BGZ94_005328 [Podila epigama]|nr:hypothetical protein BGZ94_005328 [Podila epigama]